MQRCIVGPCEHEVIVTNINNNFHIRVLVNGVINQEAVCYSRSDIGHTARSMLRMEDKCGNISEYASRAVGRESACRAKSSNNC